MEFEQTITVVALYAPNEDKPSFFTQIRKVLEERKQSKILIGDFNLTLDVELDRKNTYCNNNKARDEVLDIMDEFLLKDIWRNTYPESREFSWFKAGNINKASRIDFALVSSGLDQMVKSPMYLPGIKTDHRAFYVVVDLCPFERGAGFWKFNSSLLSDKDFLDGMSTELERTITSTGSKTPLERWEIIKVRVKKFTQNFSRSKAQQSTIVIGNLSEKVTEYETSMPLSEKDEELLLKTKQELEEKLEEKVRGSKFRSKVRWYEEGEKSSKYFFALEKAKYNAKTCFKILDEGKGEVIDPSMILEVQRNFYKELYKKDSDVEFQMANSFNVRVPADIKSQQENQLTLEELQDAIKAMSNNKTPGEDGIPVDFYKVFWQHIKLPFYDMVLAAFREQILHPSARKGILNLIPKADKDARYVKNLRPITLLNTDYKIIEKAVAGKILPALEHIIHKDQRGFMQKRRISVNIRKMLDIMDYTEREDLEAVVLSLDFVKCFDKCSFSILHGSLDFFDFGEIVKQWTKVLYTDFIVQIQNNGYFSQANRHPERSAPGGLLL